MSTIITHAVYGAAIGGLIGLALPREQRALMMHGLLFAIAPDADVATFFFDVPYESFYGHRGFFHSPFFAALCGLAVAGAVIRSGRRRAAVMGLITFGAMLSHALLDALTTGGGHGVMLLYPFSEERMYLPWRPIPVSPIGIDAFFTERGLRVVLGEIPWFLAASAAAFFSLRRGIRALADSNPESAGV